MVSATERMRIYFLGTDDGACSEAFPHFPAAAVHPVPDDPELVARIGEGDHLDLPRCLVWSLPVAQGVAVHRRLRERGIAIPAVALIAPDDVALGTQVHSCDTAFLVRPVRVPTLVDRVWSALQLDAALIPARRLRARFQLQLSTLSQREAEVLELLITGRSTKEIGSELYIGTQTVLKHRASILKKLGVRNDVELALKLRQHRESPACLCGAATLASVETLRLPRESA